MPHFTLDNQGKAVFGRYTGSAYPFGVDATGVLGAKPDVNVIITSVVNILTTPKGTIPHSPGMGSIVPWLMFEPLTDITEGLIRYYTFKDVSEQDNRVIVRSVFTERLGDLGIRVQPSLQIVGDPSGDIISAPLTWRREGGF